MNCSKDPIKGCKGHAITVQQMCTIGNYSLALSFASGEATYSAIVNLPRNFPKAYSGPEDIDGNSRPVRKIAKGVARPPGSQEQSMIDPGPACELLGHQELDQGGVRTRYIKSLRDAYWYHRVLVLGFRVADISSKYHSSSLTTWLLVRTMILSSLAAASRAVWLR